MPYSQPEVQMISVSSLTNPNNLCASNKNRHFRRAKTARKTADLKMTERHKTAKGGLDWSLPTGDQPEDEDSFAERSWPGKPAAKPHVSVTQPVVQGSEDSLLRPKTPDPKISPKNPAQGSLLDI